MTEKHHRNGKNEKITATALTNRTLILFKYFWETTDEAHPVSLADISAHLKEHGIAADRHYQLQQYGVKKRAHEDFDPVQAALVLEQVEADQQAQPLLASAEATPHG